MFLVWSKVPEASESSIMFFIWTKYFTLSLVLGIFQEEAQAHVSILFLIDSRYHDFGEVCSKDLAFLLPPDCFYCCYSNLLLRAPFLGLYNLSHLKRELHFWNGLASGLIQPSNQSLNFSLWPRRTNYYLICIAYNGLNAIMVCNRYPLSLGIWVNLWSYSLQ